MNDYGASLYSSPWTTTSNVTSGTFLYQYPSPMQKAEERKTPDTPEQWLRGRVEEICALVR